MGQNRPGAVIKSPLVSAEAYPMRFHYFRDLESQIRIAGRRIIEPEELLWEPVKIVNGPVSASP
jgi:hypothetical protein